MVGRPGPLAPRGANFTLQNSDWLLALGARLDLVVTGYAPHNFARAAKKIMVDIDGAELRKMDGAIDVPVHADVKDFIVEMTRQLGGVKPRDRSGWNARWREWQTKYPVVLPEYRESAGRREHLRAGRGDLRGVGARRRDRVGQLRRGDRDLLPRREAEGRPAPVPDDRARRDGQWTARAGRRLPRERAPADDLRRRRRRAAAQHPGARDGAPAAAADQAVRAEQRRLRVHPHVAVALLRPARRRRRDERRHAAAAARRWWRRTAFPTPGSRPIAVSSAGCGSCSMRRGRWSSRS